MGAEWPLMAKTEVNGNDCHDVYKFLRNNSELYDEKKKMAKEIPWNFGKFLIDAEGNVLGYFPPPTEPNALVEHF